LDEGISPHDVRIYLTELVQIRLRIIGPLGGRADHDIRIPRGRLAPVGG
jgi:hypothetical protein